MVKIPQRVLDIELPPFDPLNLRAGELRAQGRDVISLGQALPYFPPPPSAVRAAQAALSSPHVHFYSTDPGRPSLRRALAERLRQETWADCDAGDLVITAGANHAFATALTTLVNPGDEVVLPAPYFTNHYMQVQASGAIAIEAPLTDQKAYTVTWDDVSRALTPRTRAVVLCTPSNPTGATIARADGERIVSELASRGIWVISDETYMQFVYDGTHWSAASVNDWRRSVVVIGTFSKSFAMMGWRVGFMLADRDVCEQATKIQDAMIICAPTISQIAAEAAVNEDWDYARQFHAEFRRRRQRVAERLADGPDWNGRLRPAASSRSCGCADAPIRPRWRYVSSKTRTSSRFLVRRSVAAARVACDSPTGQWVKASLKRRSSVSRRTSLVDELSRQAALLYQHASKTTSRLFIPTPGL